MVPLNPIRPYMTLYDPIEPLTNFGNLCRYLYILWGIQRRGLARILPGLKAIATGSRFSGWVGFRGLGLGSVGTRTAAPLRI